MQSAIDEIRLALTPMLGNESQMRSALDRLGELEARLKAAEVDAQRLRGVLRKHHAWQLNQTEPDQYGIVLADAYAQSILCDETIDAMEVKNGR